jgi:LmbE family N-acetylglucosaminyl deacetylase/tetratricopeptide (TPR) repeat protein
MRCLSSPTLALLALSAASAAAAMPVPRGVRYARADAPAAAGLPASSRLTLTALAGYARAQAKVGHFEEAIDAYRRLLSRSPGNVDALTHLARLESWTGQYDHAIVLYRDALSLRPDDRELKSDLADVLTWSNRLEEAERLYERVLAQEEGHHEALKGLVRARRLRGDLEGAAAPLDRALALYPRDPDLHRERARMFSQKGELSKAAQALREASQLAPSDPAVLRELAETYQQQQDWSNAVETWLKVTQLDPEYSGSHVALGRTYLALGKLSLAREHADLARRMSPTNVAARQLAGDLERESRIGPMRSATEWAEILAYLGLLPVMFLIARRSRHSLRRRTAWAFVNYVVPAFVIFGVVAHMMRGAQLGWIDPRTFEALSNVVLFLGLCLAFVAVLRSEPTVQELAGQIVLALGAHPDDIELGCGGFLLKLKASGAKAYGLTFTRGEVGTRPDARRDLEGEKAAAFLGLDGYWVLGFPDTGLQEKIPALKAAIEAKIKELGATVVLTHSDADLHGDHRAISVATREAARRVPTVLCYEDVSTTDQFSPNFYVDISQYMDDHLKACALHRTQDHRTYMDPEVIQGRAAHRGMQVGVRYALAFRTLNMVR